MLFVANWLHPFVWGPSIGMLGWFLAGLTMSLLLLSDGLLIHRENGQRTMSSMMALCILACALTSTAMGLIQWLQWEELLGTWIIQPDLGSVVGNLRQRNQLSSLLVMGWVVLVLVVRAKGFQIWSAALTALIMLCLAMTASRTGALQLGILTVAIWLIRTGFSQRERLFALAALLAYVMSVLALPHLTSMLEGTTTGLVSRWADQNAFSRVPLWSNVSALVLQQPWYGHGWRSLAYAHYSNAFGGERFMEMLDNAHNLPLHLAVELGLPIALAFCAFAGWLICINKPWREPRPDRQLAWGILLVIGIHSIVEYPLWYGPFFMTAVMCIGILCQDAWREFNDKLLVAGKKYTRSAIILGVQVVAVSMLMFVMFAAYDYHRVSQIYLQPEDRSSWYAADPLGAAKKSVLFKSHAKFAELQITPLSRETAPRVLELSNELVRWSPEPRIIEKLIESATMMQQDELALFHLKRYKAAYPAAYTRFTSAP